MLIEFVDSVVALLAREQTRALAAPAANCIKTTQINASGLGCWVWQSHYRCVDLDSPACVHAAAGKHLVSLGCW